MEKNLNNNFMKLDINNFWKSLAQNIIIKEKSNFNSRYNFNKFAEIICQTNRRRKNKSDDFHNYKSKIILTQEKFIKDKENLKKYLKVESKKIIEVKNNINNKEKKMKLNYFLDKRKKFNKSIDFIIKIEKKNNNKEINTNLFFRTKFYKIINKNVKNYIGNKKYIEKFKESLLKIYYEFINNKKYKNFLRPKSIDYYHKKNRFYKNYRNFDDYLKLKLNIYNSKNLNNQFKEIYKVSFNKLFKMHTSKSSKFNNKQNNLNILFLINKLNEIFDLNFKEDNRKQSFNKYVNFCSKRISSILNLKKIKKRTFFNKEITFHKNSRKKKTFNNLKNVYKAIKSINKFDKLQINDKNKNSIFKSVKKQNLKKIRNYFRKNIISKTNVNYLKNSNKSIKFKISNKNLNIYNIKINRKNYDKMEWIKTSIKKEYFNNKIKNF